MRRAIPIVLFSVLCGCQKAESPAPTTPGQAFAPMVQPAVPARIHVSAVLVKIPESALGDLGARPISEVAARTDGSVLGALASGVDAEGRLQFQSPAAGANAVSYGFTVAPRVMDGDSLRLDVSLTSSDGSVSADTTLMAGDGETVIVPTKPTASDEVIALLIEARVERPAPTPETTPARAEPDAGAHDASPQIPVVEAGAMAPCADAHVAAGGCKGGFIVPEKNACFLSVEAACRCACSGPFVSCTLPPARADALPGPVAPNVVCR